MLGFELRMNNETNLNGIFIAKVIDNMDPKACERVRVRILGVHDMENEEKENSIWANHLAPSKGGSGEIPDNDDFVYVTFIQNDPMHCLWLGWARTIKGGSAKPKSKKQTSISTPSVSGSQTQQTLIPTTTKGINSATEPVAKAIPASEITSTKPIVSSTASATPVSENKPEDKIIVQKTVTIKEDEEVRPTIVTDEFKTKYDNYISEGRTHAQSLAAIRDELGSEAYFIGLGVDKSKIKTVEDQDAYVATPEYEATMKKLKG